MGMFVLYNLRYRSNCGNCINTLLIFFLYRCQTCITLSKNFPVIFYTFLSFVCLKLLFSCFLNATYVEKYIPKVISTCSFLIFFVGEQAKILCTKSFLLE